MNILICDDEAVFAQQLKTPIIEYFNSRSIVADVDVTVSPADVVSGSVCYDIAFLDIQMGDISGLDLAHILQNRNPDVIIFFVTAYDRYQDSAMDLHAFRFFSKPFEKERLISGLDKAMENINSSSSLFVSSGTRQVRVRFKDIVCVSRANRRVTVSAGTERITSNEDFEYWCSTLNTGIFYRVHKSFLVNLNHIQEYRYNSVKMDNGDEIPVASRRCAEFHKVWFDFLRRR